MKKKQLPLIGDLVTFIEKLQYDGPLHVLKPDPKMRFKSCSVSARTLFVVLGRLGDAEYHAMKTFCSAWEESAVDTFGSQFWCFGPEGICIISELSLEIVSSRGRRQSRVSASACE